MLTASRGSLVALLTLLLAGCSSLHDEVPRPDSPYCLRGGSDEVYSCDPARQAPLATPVQTSQNADSDLDARLADIKQWLSSEKAAMQQTPGTGDESDVLLPPPSQQRQPFHPPPPARAVPPSESQCGYHSHTQQLSA